MASSQNPSAIKGGTGTTGTPANNVGGDRRGSSSGTLFSGLMTQKRNSTDAAAEARRQSASDMAAKPGVIGKMWETFTKGPSGSDSK